MGRFNLAIFGKSGVGKSTLINAVFGENVANTGIGEPVTKDSQLHVHREGVLGIYDTRGLEIGEDGKKIIKELRSYIAKTREADLSEQVHVVWYCVCAGDNRFEAHEADFIRELHKLGLPPADKLVYQTYAQSDDFTGQVAHGAKELVDATFRVVPEGVEAALTASQKVDEEQEWKRAQSVTLSAASATMGYAWAGVCIKMAKGELDPSKASVINAVFLAELKSQMGKLRLGKPADAASAD